MFHKALKQQQSSLGQSFSTLLWCDFFKSKLLKIVMRTEGSHSSQLAKGISCQEALQKLPFSRNQGLIQRLVRYSKVKKQTILIQALTQILKRIFFILPPQTEQVEFSSSTRQPYQESLTPSHPCSSPLLPTDDPAIKLQCPSTKDRSTRLEARLHSGKHHSSTKHVLGTKPASHY